MAGAWIQPPVQAAEISLVSPPAVSTSASDEVAAPRELAVIDTQIPESERLVADLRTQQQAGRAIDIVLIDASDNGLERISQALNSGVSYDAVHVLAHGEAGAMELGASRLDLAAVRASAGEFALWSTGMSSNADLLLYGCDLAANDDGRQLIEALAVLTGADVAASTDQTGHALLDADWRLEASTGQIEAAVIASDEFQQSWLATLTTSAATADQIVNVTTTGQQGVSTDHSGHQIASNGTLSVVVFQNFNDNSIRFRFMDPAGPIGNEYIAHVQAGGQLANPSVAIDDGGNVTIVWQDDVTAGDTDGTGISLRRFDSNGQPISTLGTTDAVRVNTTIAGAQSQAAIASRPDGGLVVTWTSETAGGTGTEIRARLIDANGLSPGADFQVNAIAAGNQHHSAVAVGGVAGDMQIVVTWQSEGTDGSGSGIYARRFAIDGNARDASEWRVNVTTANNQVQPAIAADNNQNFAIVWTSEDAPGNFVVKVRSFTGDGLGIINNQNNNAVADVDITDLTGATDHSVAIAMDRAAGNFVVAFVSDTGSNAQIYRTQFNSAGVRQESNLLVPQYGTGEQSAPSVAVSAGRAYIVWNGNGVDGGRGLTDVDGVFMRAFTINQPSVLMTIETGSQIAEGTQTTLGVRLSGSPGGLTPANVDLYSIDSSGAVIDHIGPLQFTALNWWIPQYVTVSVSDDTIHTGDISMRIYATPTSWGSSYDGVNGTQAAVTLLDNDDHSVLVVDTASDTVDAPDGPAWTLYGQRGADGKISLREAIRALNSPLNVAGAVPDEIRFNLPQGSSTLSLASALPALTRSIYINGSSQPQYAGQQRVVLTSVANGTFDGLTLAAGSDNSRINGLVINGFGGWGIDVQSNGVSIDQNFIGTSTTGQVAVGNRGGGIIVRPGASMTLIDGNLIAGNDGDAIRISGAALTTVVANRLGIDLDGIASPATTSDDGIEVSAGATGTKIAGNWIGGFQGAGIRVRDAGTTNTQIRGNWIGASADGTQRFGNADGIRVENGAVLVEVGGLQTGQGNVIADGSGNGVVITGAATQQVLVHGNFIGTNVGGTAQLGNLGNGVLISGGAHGNLIGGGSVEAANLIFFNNTAGSGQLAGVLVLDDASVGNAIVGNRFDGNGRAIDLRNSNGSSEPDVIDIGDGDSGANDLLNRPQILSIAVNGGATTIDYRLANLPGSYRIDFYRDPTPNADGSADGPLWLGAHLITLATTGGSFSYQLTSTALSVGEAVSATVTQINTANGGFVETSEFAAPLVFNHPPTLQAPTDFLHDENKTGPVATLSATDPDAGHTVTIALDPSLDSQFFAFDPNTGALSFKAPPDFESAADAGQDNVYDLDFVLTDSLGLSNLQHVTVSVLPVNEAPSGTSSTVVMQEDGVYTFSAASFGFTDPDQNSTLGAVRISSPPATGTGILTLAGTAVTAGQQVTLAQLQAGALVYQPPANASGTALASLGFRVIDDAGLIDPLERQLTVTVQSLANDPPVLTSNGGGELASLAIDESTNFVTVLTASDPDGQALSFTISGGADSALFSIEPGNVLVFRGLPDYESLISSAGNHLFSVNVSVSDGTGLTDTQSMTISVGNVDEPPRITQTAYDRIEGGRDVQLIGADPEQGNTGLTYAIAGGIDRTRFSIEASTGRLIFVADPDFESPASAAGSNTYQLQIQVQDGAGNISVSQVTVSVIDRNEAPLLLIANPIAGDEDQVLALNGAIDLTDPDANANPLQLDIALVDATQGHWSLGNTTGLVFTAGDGVDDAQLRFSGSFAAVQAAVRSLQFSPAANFNGAAAVVITATDIVDVSGAPLLDSKTFSMTIRPINDAPAAGGNVMLDVPAAATAQLTRDQLAASDVDNSAAQLRYELLEAPLLGVLEIDGVTLAAGASFTQADIDAGRIGYRHLATTTGADRAVLRLSDGAGGSVAQIELKVTVSMPVAVPETSTSQTSSTGTTGGTSGATGTVNSTGTASTSTSTGSDGGSTDASAGVALVAKPPVTAAAPAPAGGAVKSSTVPVVRAAAVAAATGASGSDSSGTASGAQSDARFSGSAAALARGLNDSHGPSRQGFELPGARRDVPVSLATRLPEQSARYEITRAALRQELFREQLTEVRNQVTERVALERNVAASGVAVSTGLSIGYVVWLLRGGVLLSSLLAAVPAWSAIDPLPVLSRFGDDDGAEDDESLQEMLKRADAAQPRRGVAPPPVPPADRVSAAGADVTAGGAELAPVLADQRAIAAL